MRAFRITDVIAARLPHQIIIRMRPLLALMGFPVQGIEPPVVHLAQGITGGACPPAGAKFRCAQNWPISIDSAAPPVRPWQARLATEANQNHPRSAYRVISAANG